MDVAWGFVGEKAGDSDLSADFLNFGAGDFPFKISLKKCFKIVFCFFFALAPRSGFEAAISHAVARTSFVFCNSISPYRIVMAASRLLGVAAACVILWSFAAVHSKSYWTGCIKAAIVICQQIFSSLVLVIFLSKFLLKSASKSCFFSLWRRGDPVVELQFLTPCVFPLKWLQPAMKGTSCGCDRFGVFWFSLGVLQRVVVHVRVVLCAC